VHQLALNCRLGSHTAPTENWRDFSGFRSGLLKLRTGQVSVQLTIESPHTGSYSSGPSNSVTGRYRSVMDGAWKPAPAEARSTSDLSCW
jgi:hypothetical protein